MSTPRPTWALRPMISPRVGASCRVWRWKPTVAAFAMLLPATDMPAWAATIADRPICNAELRLMGFAETSFATRIQDNLLADRCYDLMSTAAGVALPIA